MAQKNTPQIHFLNQKKRVCTWYRVHTFFFSVLFCFLFFLKFSFSFLPLDGSDGARATLRRLGLELIMNKKRVDTKEISDILILFTFLGGITYIASDSNRGKIL